MMIPVQFSAQNGFLEYYSTGTLHVDRLETK
jgi:hypothetical protein